MSDTYDDFDLYVGDPDWDDRENGEWSPAKCRWCDKDIRMRWRSRDQKWIPTLSGKTHYCEARRQEDLNKATSLLPKLSP